MNYITLTFTFTVILSFSTMVKMYSLLLIVALLGGQQLHAQTVDRINAAKTKILAFLNTQGNARFGPGFVRVAFHDCVGGCNGCIKLCQAGNAGIRQYTDALEALRDDPVDDFSTDFTRADFWALASVAALERAVQVPGGGRGGPPPPPRPGRKRRSLSADSKRERNEIREQLDEILEDLKDLEGQMNTVEERRRRKKDPQRPRGRNGDGYFETNTIECGGIVIKENLC